MKMVSRWPAGVLGAGSPSVLGDEDKHDQSARPSALERSVSIVASGQGRFCDAIRIGWTPRLVLLKLAQRYAVGGVELAAGKAGHIAVPLAVVTVPLPRLLCGRALVPSSISFFTALPTPAQAVSGDSAIGRETADAHA